MALSRLSWSRAGVNILSGHGRLYLQTFEEVTVQVSVKVVDTLQSRRGPAAGSNP